MIKKTFLVLLLSLFLASSVLASGNDGYTVSLLHFNGDDESTTFTDDAAGGTHSWSATGNAQLDTAKKTFGTASGLFDGSGDYIDSADSADWNFGTGDFTIDFHIILNADESSVFISQGNTTPTNTWMLYYEPSGTWLYFYVWDAGGSLIVNMYRDWSPSTDTDYHVALVRYGNALKMFVAGSQLGGDEDCTGLTMPDSEGTLRIGDRHIAGLDLNGWIDEMRVSKGIARWTTEFTPPTAEYTAVSSQMIRTEIW